MVSSNDGFPSIKDPVVIVTIKTLHVSVSKGFLTKIGGKN